MLFMIKRQLNHIKIKIIFNTSGTPDPHAYGAKNFTKDAAINANKTENPT